MTAGRFDPFGQGDCESELRMLEGGYGDVYVRTPFSEQVEAPETYLIIGRRGSGKTALSQPYSFHQRLRDPMLAFGVSSTNDPVVTLTPGETVLLVAPAVMVATPLTLSIFTRPLVRSA